MKPMMPMLLLLGACTSSGSLPRGPLGADTGPGGTSTAETPTDGGTTGKGGLVTESFSHECEGTASYNVEWPVIVAAGTMPPRAVVWTEASAEYLAYQDALNAWLESIGSTPSTSVLLEGGRYASPMTIFSAAGNMVSTCNWIAAEVDGVSYEFFYYDRFDLVVER